ncbi:restriction endonuclease PLD domain-containing protein [Campylobacter avium]|uniref:restriction endonuclease PLD domain-containing protein n=1 Tax=Campylobacter avium TaxID=522485 RepID=UPI00255B9745|nr:restriction endonuclease PLD domain-containing protein [Campylobacter avium]
MDFFKLDSEKNLKYTESIQIISSLSKLFSENEIPFLHYRVMENLFCDCFSAKNLSRSDTAFDAQINTLGIGLKTFICQKDYSVEKIAEFNKLAPKFKDLQDRDLAYTLAQLRNERIQSAKNIYGITDSIYHIVARQKNKLIFFETDYAEIDLNTIKSIKGNEKSLSFKDSCNEYSFNRSKSVLQRKFYIPKEHSSIGIKILENPFTLLLSLKEKLENSKKIESKVAGVNYVVLPLYSDRGGYKNVPAKSGLNQWNAGGRKRSYGEVYIPVPMFIHKTYPNFFPSRDTPFTLITPDNEKLSVKLCQDNSKALMSNPNTALATWLLGKVLRLKEGELATYERMQILGFDSVFINKLDFKTYSIDIASLDSYENFKG